MEQPRVERSSAMARPMPFVAPLVGLDGWIECEVARGVCSEWKDYGEVGLC
jgi:hypothetical protein